MSDDKKTTTTTSETRAKDADIGDMITGKVGEHGEKLDNGHPVLETKETKVETKDDEQVLN